MILHRRSIGFTKILFPFIVLSTTIMYVVQNNLGEFSYQTRTLSPGNKKEVEEQPTEEQTLNVRQKQNAIIPTLKPPRITSNDDKEREHVENKALLRTPKIIKDTQTKLLRTGDNNKQQDNKINIAWLMSFPKSGTTYTLSLYQAASKKTAATNYGIERFEATGTTVIESNMHSSVPLLKDNNINNTSLNSLNGPFRLTPNLPLPSNGGYVLTKTHCSGYCFDCPPNWYNYSPTRFLKGCVTGQYYNEQNKTSVWVNYDPTIIKKAIHIMRDPFDNIVSRYHHEIFRHRNDKNSNKDWNHTLYTKSIEGFRAWCDYQDEKWKFHFKTSWDEELYDAAQHVPCKKEFYQYIKWHNNAFEVIRAMDIPRIIIHYEDYAYNLQATTDKMMQFLQHDVERYDRGENNNYPKVRDLIHYMEYYRPYMLKYVIHFLKLMSTTETWFVLIRRYPYLGNAPPLPAELPDHGDTSSS